VTRHGNAVWYVRIGRGPRLRIRAAFGTPEFNAEYHAAISAAPRPKNGAPAAGTLAWLIARYRETEAWSALSPATRRKRERFFREVIATAGNDDAGRIRSSAVAAGRDRRAKTAPHGARHFVDAMRGLFRWAVNAKLVKTDPTVGVDYPVRPRSDGFVMWHEEHVEAFERRWPIGTRQRVWLDVLLYTGLRRGDAVRFGRQHVRDGVGRIRTEKTGMEVTLPILPVLARTLEAGPCGDLTFIAGERGQPLTKESFGNLFRDACKVAGVPGSAHGLRKVAASRAALQGASTSQLNAIFGWKGHAMASLYTEAADRQRLAKEAMHKLGKRK
jgi:integrase